MVVYPLILWFLDFSFMKQHHWAHYILGGILFGVITVTVLYFLDKIKKNKDLKKLG
jgi:hypothetical protein